MLCYVMVRDNYKENVQLVAWDKLNKCSSTSVLVAEIGDHMHCSLSMYDLESFELTLSFTLSTKI